MAGRSKLERLIVSMGAKGASVGEIAAKAGCTRTEVESSKKRMRRAGVTFTPRRRGFNRFDMSVLPEKPARALALFDAGLSLRQIAALTGIGDKGVARNIDRARAGISEGRQWPADLAAPGGMAKLLRETMAALPETIAIFADSLAVRARRAKHGSCKRSCLTPAMVAELDLMTGPKCEAVEPPTAKKSEPRASEPADKHPQPKATLRSALKPGDLYRERLACGALSPWVSIVPEARDFGRFDWEHLFTPSFSPCGSPAAMAAGL